MSRRPRAVYARSLRLATHPHVIHTPRTTIMPGLGCHPVCCPIGPPLPVKATSYFFTQRAAPSSPVIHISCTGYARHRLPPATLAHTPQPRPITDTRRSHSPLPLARLPPHPAADRHSPSPMPSASTHRAASQCTCGLSYHSLPCIARAVGPSESYLQCHNCLLPSHPPSTRLSPCPSDSHRHTRTVPPAPGSSPRPRQ